MSRPIYTEDGRRLYTTAQLAEELGVTAEAIRSRLHRQKTEPYTRLDARTPLWTLPKEPTMTKTITTEYGSWNTQSGTGVDTVTEAVAAALGEFASDYDLDALASEYAAAINKALADTGVTLNGSEFYGPHPRAKVDIRAIVEGVDFWEIAARHEK